MIHPARIEAVTAEWLNDRLVEQGVPDDARIVAFEAEPVPRQGMTSLAHVLTLQYDREPAGAPARLLAKFSLDSEPIKQALGANRGFEREVAFYQQVGDQAGIPVPRCYWAAYDESDTTCGLLMEHLEPTRTTDVFSGTTSEIEQVVLHLAPFHARWWGRTGALDRLYPGQAPFIVELFIERLAPALEEIKARYREEVGETLIALLELWLPHAHRLARHEVEQAQTLCHGDLHRDQILFPASGAGCWLIDWQLAAIDSGPTDLARLLVSGLLPEQRRQAERALVERYHAGLLEHGVTGYALEDAWDSYRAGIARLALFYLTAFATGDVAPVIAWWESDERRRGFSFWEVNCGWPAQALEQHQVLDHLARIVASAA